MFKFISLNISIDQDYFFLFTLKQLYNVLENTIERINSYFGAKYTISVWLSLFDCLLDLDVLNCDFHQKISHKT